MTLWYSSRKPADLGELAAMKWCHNITFEEDFLCEFGAREAAHKLALEMHLEGNHMHPLKPSPSTSLRSSLRKRTSSSLRVGFADWTCLFLGEEDSWRMERFSLPSFYFACESTPWSGCAMIADMRRSRFQVRPWHDTGSVRSCSPGDQLDEKFLLAQSPEFTQCKIIDNHLDNPARRFQQEEAEPDPDTIPDIHDAPPFAQDLQAIADEQEAFSDPDGDGVLRLRTWYLHHDNYHVNFHARTVELEEDWRRWETDINGSWRSHLHPGASIFFHLAIPDPYRGYLRRRVHGDIIITQGNDLPRRAGLVTVHYHGRDLAHHSYAVACSLELTISGLRITEMSDADQWCLREHHSCSIAHGWNRIPFDHRPVHQMQNGHSFVITVTESNEHRGHRNAIDPHQAGLPVTVTAQGDLDYEEQAPDQHRSRSPSYGDSDGHSAADEEVGVHIYRLERPEGHCFLSWSSYGHILLDLTRCLDLRRNDVIGFHPLIVSPVGLHESHEKAVILQATADISPGSREQLILIDLEIHFHALSDGLLIPPTVTRKVYRILPPLHRKQILLILGLLDYCELHGDHCTIFHNRQLWHLQDRTVHDLTHGSYLRVLVPPPADSTLDTRRAIAISREFSLAAHRTQMRLDCQASGSHEQTGDHSSFFQKDLRLSLATCVRPTDQVPLRQFKVAPEHVTNPSLSLSTSGNELPQRAPRPLTRFFDRDFDTLQNLFRSHSMIECEEEGNVAYIDTWFIHHELHPRCADPRAVKLFQDPSSWLEDILAPWEDFIDVEHDIILYLVRPMPPCTIMECLLAHVIIEQAPRPEVVVGLLTTHETGDHGVLIDHTAWSLSNIMTSNTVIHLVDFQVECRFRRCSVYRGHIPFGLFDFDEVEPGSCLVVYVHPDPTRGASSESSSLLQLPPKSPTEGLDAPRDTSTSNQAERFAFNPTARRFCPGRASHSHTPSNVQELDDLWHLTAFSWEGEEPFITVITWFVDQFNPALHSCWTSRAVRLQGDAQHWKGLLRQAWNDRQLQGAPILIHVVRPPPPLGDQSIAAHVLLIQNPLDDVSSSLVTFFDTERRTTGPNSQFAMTSRTVIALEDLINQFGLATRCLGIQPPSICAAWIGTNLIIVGRPMLIYDGSGIIFQVSRRPTIQELQAHAGGLNLLQVSAQRNLKKGRRLTHGLVAHTHGPPADTIGAGLAKSFIKLIKAGEIAGTIPSYIDIPAPPSVDKIINELTSFGLQCKVALLSDEFTALVFPKNATEDETKHHFVYVSQSDPGEIHLHTFSLEHLPDELGHMQHLYQLGFEKAVIIENIWHQVGITEIVFTVSIGMLSVPDQEAKTLPEWPPQQPRRPHEAMLQDRFCKVSAPCNLNCGIGLEDLKALFTSSKGTLCTSFEGLDLPELCQRAFAGLAHHDHFDRLIIYTDGSSQTRHKHVDPMLNEEIGIPDAWCFLVIGETYLTSSTSELTLIGWSAHQVRCGQEDTWTLGADHTGSAIAEREALTWAMLWRIGQNSNIPTFFRSDSMLTLQQARGEIGASQCDASFQTLRGCAQLLETALGPQSLLFDHIPGHAGDPFNEFCDHIAKLEGRQGFFLKRPKLDLHTWRPIIPFLWMLFDTTSGLPEFQGQGFNVHPPALPPIDDPRPAVSIPARTRKIEFNISIATGNVQSLGRGDQGFAGKIGFIRSQQLALHLNFIGLQETRSDEGSSLQHGIFRLSSGHSQGQGGVELWCNLRQPLARVNNKEVFLQRKHFCVLHRDCRRLLVRVQHDLWEAWILVAYAPQSGHSLAERSTWWYETQDILSSTGVDHQALIVCIDANAGLGEPDGLGVCSEGFRTSSGTRLLRGFLSTFSLCAPIAGPAHTGSTCTWTSPLGEEFTIDYVLLPIDWHGRCHNARVLEEFDMGNICWDHSAYVVELTWTAHQLTGRRHEASGNSGVLFDRASIQRSMPPNLRSIAVASWGTDVEEHLDQLNSHLHSQLRQFCPKPRRGPSKPYIDEKVWALRSTKLQHKKQLRLLRTLLRRETLARIFHAWSAPSSWEPEESFAFGSTLRVGVLLHGLGLRRSSVALRKEISRGKQTVLAATVEQISPSTSASEIQQKLRPFLGAKNKLRQGLSPLPLIKDDKGAPCTSTEATLNRWIDFFSEMEGGERITLEEQRSLWRANLQALSSQGFNIDITEIPSLTELEQTCRQVKAGKASGMDGLPSELIRFCPSTIAKQFYSLMLKICLQGQEPLEHKGGYLVPIWKGKLAKDTCHAFRSILISSMIGKTLHKALRTKQNDLYQRFLHSQQLGGRKGISVVLGGHLIRAFLRVFEACRQPTAVLFIDLQEAFYRVVRPLAISGEWSDETIATMCARLQMDPHLVHDLYDHLQAPSAVESAQMNVVARKAIQALHSDTFFALHGQTDRVRTVHGSRPGDSFADVVFGFLMARVLRDFEDALQHQDILSEFPQENIIDLHGKRFQESEESTKLQQRMLGPCWMDDLAIPLTASTNDQLMHNLGVATSTILDICRSHAMTPNLNKGKTEIILQPRGPGSQTLRRELFGPVAPKTFLAVGEYGTYNINLVNTYVHLGGLTHFSGDLRKEIKRRVAIAHQAFNKHRKIIYQNAGLNIAKRVEIFNSLVLSRLLFGAETWYIKDVRTKEYLHCAIVRLYKRLLKVPHDAHVSDEEVFHRLGVPCPSTLLRVRRLSYLGSLLSVGSSAHWGLLNKDTAWIALLQDDLQWTGDQLSRSCSLGDPYSHTERWLEVIQFHRGYWRRLLRRAREHSILVASRSFVCASAQLRLKDMMENHGVWDGPTFSSSPSHAVNAFFGCLTCSLRCKSAAGEGAHMFKTHGLTHPVRTLIAGTQCGACLTEYFTHGKLKAHLIRADHCRQQLLGRRHCFAPSAGLGSLEDTQRHERWDGRLPPLQAAGPTEAPVVLRDFDVEHAELFEAVTILIVEIDENSIREFATQLQQLSHRWPISWTTWTRTFQSLIVFFEDAELDLSRFLQDEIRRCLEAVCQPTYWPFLQAARVQTLHQPSCAEVEDILAQARWSVPEERIPRPCSRERIFLHIFSGRRRVGDLQFYMEKVFVSICHDGSTLCVVSLDLVIDDQYGDVRRPETQAFWRHGVLAGWVLGALCGPPCETWSQARFVEDELHPGRGPRPLRDRECLWGFESLSLKEANQVAIGNELLLFVIEVLYALACTDGFGVLEHPQEPEDPARPSIWHLQAIHLLRRFSGVEIIDIAQGLLGANSPKPTRLLALNLPDLRSHIRQHHVTRDLPKRSAIGRSDDGTWRTAPLKEYPPALNRAFSHAFWSWFRRNAFCTNITIEPCFLSRCRAMTVSAFGTIIGRDFGG